VVSPLNAAWSTILLTFAVIAIAGAIVFTYPPTIG
jgi:hypothetical protein